MLSLLRPETGKNEASSIHLSKPVTQLHAGRPAGWLAIIIIIIIATATPSVG